MIQNKFLEFTSLENFSLTSIMIADLYEDGAADTAYGSLRARVVGFIATPFTSAIDLVAHGFLCAVKIVTGVPVSAYNFIARNINPEYMAPVDLEISSALIHLVRMIDIVFRAALLPFIMLISPSRGYLLAREQSDTLTTLLVNQNEQIKIKESLLEAETQEFQEQQNAFEQTKIEFETKLQEFQEQQNAFKQTKIEFETKLQEEKETLGKQKEELTTLSIEFKKIYEELESKNNKLKEHELKIEEMNNELINNTSKLLKMEAELKASEKEVEPNETKAKENIEIESPEIELLKNEIELLKNEIKKQKLLVKEIISKGDIHKTRLSLFNEIEFDFIATLSNSNLESDVKNKLKEKDMNWENFVKLHEEVTLWCCNGKLKDQSLGQKYDQLKTIIKHINSN